eukprot:4696317-Amphidinium_carterae.1
MSHKSVHNAVAFVRSSAVEEICTSLEQNLLDRDLFRHGLYALGCLAHFGSGSQQARAANADFLAIRGMQTHRQSRSVQINACE